MRTWWRDRDLIRAQLEREQTRRAALLDELRAETRLADEHRELARGATMVEAADELDTARWETAALIRVVSQLRAWNRDGCTGPHPFRAVVSA